MHDSGKRERFASGAVRDTAQDKPRPDLISPFALERLGEWLRIGAERRGQRHAGIRGGQDHLWRGFILFPIIGRKLLRFGTACQHDTQETEDDEQILRFHFVLPALIALQSF